MRRPVVLAALGLALGACAGAPEVAQDPLTPVAGFRCPPAGTSVTYDTGQRITWTGVDPADPAVCLRRVETAAGREEQPALFNDWCDTGRNHRVIRAGMTPLFPPAPGRAASFSRPAESARGDALDDLERWRVAGRETVPVGAQQRDPWRIQRVTEFSSWAAGAFSGALTLWFDAETFVLLRVRVDDVKGIWRGVGPRAAVALHTPGG